MLSNFGGADGGRETWAYNFIPRLLNRYPELRLGIFGLRVDGERDNSATVLSAVPETDCDRLSIGFVRAKADRWPNAVAFWTGLPKLARNAAAPAFVIAVGSWVELLAALRVKRFRRAGKLVWLRSVFADEKAHRYPALLRPLLERMELAVLRRADLIIANGEDTANHYRRFGLKVPVIPNAVDLDRWRMAPPQLEPPLKVFYVGRLAPAKGIDEFIALAKSLAADPAETGRFEFHVIGEGPGAIAAAAAEGRGWLRYHGPLPNEAMPALLETMDVSVQLGFAGKERTTKSGGSGVSNALLEQAAAERVLVCWDNAAYRQVLDDTSCYFVPQGGLQALRDTIRRIAASPEEGRSKAIAAGYLARGYSFDRHMDMFAEAIAPWLPSHAETT